MFVCLCNAISDKDLKNLADAGVRSVDDAYAQLGGQVQCGQCRTLAKTILNGNDEETIYDPSSTTLAAE